jgi:prevent-host-death family protein
MIPPTNVRPLSDFQRRSKEVIARLKKTGDAEVLTVNGRAAVVVQDAAAYERLAELAAKYELLAAVDAGLAQADAGLGRPLAAVRADFERRAPRAPRARTKPAAPPLPRARRAG